MKSLKIVASYLIILTLTFSGLIVQDAKAEIKKARNYVFDTVHTTIEDQAVAAKYIVDGVVQSSEVVAQKGDVPEHYLVKIKVNEWIKGESAWTKAGNSKGLFVAKIWTATKSAFSFSPGDDVISAFHGESKIGFTTPIAAGEGLYKAEKTAGGQGSDGGKVAARVFINKNKNFGLTRNFKTRQTINSLDKSLIERLDDGNVTKDDLKDAFRQLVKE